MASWIQPSKGISLGATETRKPRSIGKTNKHISVKDGAQRALGSAPIIAREKMQAVRRNGEEIEKDKAECLS